MGGRLNQVQSTHEAVHGEHKARADSMEAWVVDVEEKTGEHCALQHFAGD